MHEDWGSGIIKYFQNYKITKIICKLLLKVYAYMSKLTVGTNVINY